MKKSPKLPGYLLGKYQLIGTVTFSVLFAIVFLNIYVPFSDTASSKGAQNYLNLAQELLDKHSRENAG